jgi:hypothetical protein
MLIPPPCCFYLCFSFSIRQKTSLLMTQTDNNRMLSQVYDNTFCRVTLLFPTFTSSGNSPCEKTRCRLAHPTTSTDALHSYGSSGTFDPAKDRAVLKLDQWKNPVWPPGKPARLFNVRRRLPHRSRPQPQQTAYGSRCSNTLRQLTESPHTRTARFEKRHVDEHHEEISDHGYNPRRSNKLVSCI